MSAVPCQLEQRPSLVLERLCKPYQSTEDSRILLLSTIPININSVNSKLQNITSLNYKRAIHEPQVIQIDRMQVSVSLEPYHKALTPLSPNSILTSSSRPARSPCAGVLNFKTHDCVVPCQRPTGVLTNHDGVLGFFIALLRVIVWQLGTPSKPVACGGSAAVYY